MYLYTRNFHAVNIGGQIGSLIARSKQKTNNEEHLKFAAEREEKAEDRWENWEAVYGRFPSVSIGDEAAHETADQIS